MLVFGSTLAMLYGMAAECFSEAYETGFRRTVSFLKSRGVEHDTAADVAQWAWTRGWERLAVLWNDAVVLTWVTTIAWNRYLGLLRSSRTEALIAESHADKSELNWAALDVARILQTCRPNHVTRLSRRFGPPMESSSPPTRIRLSDAVRMYIKRA